MKLAPLFKDSLMAHGSLPRRDYGVLSIIKASDICKAFNIQTAAALQATRKAPGHSNHLIT